jgi:hypothetical protein
MFYVSVVFFFRNEKFMLSSSFCGFGYMPIESRSLWYTVYVYSYL